MSNGKKRHHYIPVCYLKNFTNLDGHIFAFNKDDVHNPLHTIPREIGFERYYYSQPTLDGERDNNTLEDFFGTLETNWPGLVTSWQAEESTNEKLEFIFQFLGLLRVRVPAMRDFVELSLAQKVRALTRQMGAAGELPSPPDGHDDLLDHLQVSIDPHQSIHAMTYLLRGFGQLLDRIGFEIVHNQTKFDLLTSDNPVAVFDPQVSELRLRPYVIAPQNGSIELLCPVTPRMFLRGHTDLKFEFSNFGLKHRRTTDVQEIKRHNRMISRFGYRFIFANETTNSPIIEKYASTSPTLKTSELKMQDGINIFNEWTFGPRATKIKWNPA